LGKTCWRESLFTLAGLTIGPRLMLCFGFITLSMLAGDAVVLWQFHLIRAQASV